MRGLSMTKTIRFHENKTDSRMTLRKRKTWYCVVQCFIKCLQTEARDSSSFMHTRVGITVCIFAAKKNFLQITVPYILLYHEYYKLYISAVFLTLKL